MKKIILTLALIAIADISAQNREILASNVANGINQLLSNIIPLVIETTSPKLKDAITKEDAQELANILDEVKKIEWKEYINNAITAQTIKGESVPFETLGALAVLRKYTKRVADIVEKYADKFTLDFQFWEQLIRKILTNLSTSIFSTVETSLKDILPAPKTVPVIPTIPLDKKTL